VSPRRLVEDVVVQARRGHAADHDETWRDRRGRRGRGGQDRQGRGMAGPLPGPPARARRRMPAGIPLGAAVGVSPALRARVVSRRVVAASVAAP
jgi:hypothetical protein